MTEPGWGAWRCYEPPYAQLVFESADADRYTRSLAPVDVAGEDALGDSDLAELDAYQASRSSITTAHRSACENSCSWCLVLCALHMDDLCCPCWGEL